MTLSKMFLNTLIRQEIMNLCKFYSFIENNEFVQVLLLQRFEPISYCLSVHLLFVNIISGKKTKLMSTLQKFLSVKEHEESISNLYMRRNCTNSLFSILRNSMCPLKKTLRMCQMFLRVAPLFLMRTKPLYFMHINLCFSITNETRV